MALQNKHIVLGVTGGIAAYKSADLVRRLREAGAIVQVVMTANAEQFITKLTLQALSGYPVRSTLFDPAAEAAMGHIELARWADMIIVAPASADFIARLATGRADDLLATICLATRAPIVVAPAMNQMMWQHTLTQKNLQVLQANGIYCLGPAQGQQACGEVGPGRLLEPADIVSHVDALLLTGDLAGLKLVVTAGPTQEALDPVRFLSNASSGKMGYAVAQAAIEAGATVTLISGPVSGLTPPQGALLVPVVSAEEMYTAVMQRTENCDIFVAVAAVADYYFPAKASNKISKDEATLHLTLARTADIVTAVAQQAKKPFIVGFAAETENLIARAQEKRLRKGMDVIIANQVGANMGFHSDENAVTVLWEEKGTLCSEQFSRCAKTLLAKQLLHLLGKIYRRKHHHE